MQPSKNLTFKYRTINPVFRCFASLISIVFSVFIWFLFLSSASEEFLMGMMILLIYTSPLTFPLFCILMFYIIVILPIQLILSILNSYDSLGNVLFYEDHVMLYYNNTKEVRLDKNNADIDIDIIHDKKISCLIKTPKQKVSFVSSKREIPGNNDYKGTSLYYAMNEVIEFIHPQKAERSDDAVDDPSPKE